MKKVLLVTLWGYENFGNRLQAIALKKMIEANNYQVECVPNYYSIGIKQHLKKAAKWILGIMGIKKYKQSLLLKKRNKALKESCSDLLSPLTSNIYNFNFRNKINAQDYVTAIVGSDQVWHRWTTYDSELDYYYLDFMPPTKRISYAASFGFDVFPAEDENNHINGLKNMNLISCRELTGCKLVEQSTNKNAELVLDPTLCVEKSFWDSIEQKPGYFMGNDFILVMLLGSKNDYCDKIKEYAELNHLDIIDLTDINNRSVWETTINNFIWLVHNAKVVCTDSFHCSVFSIIYEKPVTIFRRRQKGLDDMYDRIATLLDICKLRHCEYKDHIIDSVPDYDTAKENINSMIDKSKNWLSMALKTVESQKGIQES